MPIFNKCFVCFESAPDVTIVECPAAASGIHGPGLSGRCEGCLRKGWLANRAPYKLNGERAKFTEQQRYYNNIEVACQACIHSTHTLTRLPGTGANYHYPACRRRADDPDHQGPCTRTCLKTKFGEFGDTLCRFHDCHDRLCEPVTAANHQHVPPENVLGKRRQR